MPSAYVVNMRDYFLREFFKSLAPSYCSLSGQQCPRADLRAEGGKEAGGAVGAEVPHHVRNLAEERGEGALRAPMDRTRGTHGRRGNR